MVGRGTACWLCGVALVVGCARTDLLAGFPADTGGSSAGRAGAGGGSAGVNGGANAGTGFGGTFVSAGGGGPGDGALGGRLEQHAELFAGNVRVNALDAAPDGRVAMGGSFEGQLDFGGQVLTSLKEGAGFVAVYDASSRLEWARSVDGPGSELVTGLAFTPTPDGAVVAQGQISASIALDGQQVDDKQFAVRFDGQGTPVWRQDFGNNRNQPSKVVVDPKGDAWLAGTLSQQRTFGARPLNGDGDGGYLLRLNAAGELVDSVKVVAEGCPATELADVAADVEGRLIVTGACNGHAFLQRRDATGALAFEKRITGTLSFSLGSLVAAVDRTGRIMVGTKFMHSLENGEGETVFQAPDTTADLWFAQYTPVGERLWQRTYPSKAPGVTLAALAADPFGDILALGECSDLRFGLVEIISRPDRSGSPPAYVLKLHPDGTPVWAHLMDGGMTVKAMTADATAHVWLAGEFSRKTWFDDQMIAGNETLAGLVLRLSP